MQWLGMKLLHECLEVCQVLHCVGNITKANALDSRQPFTCDVHMGNRTKLAFVLEEVTYEVSLTYSILAMDEYTDVIYL
jgi:hypothetical protein